MSQTNMPGKTGEQSPSNRTSQANSNPSAVQSQRTSSSPIRPAVEPLSPVLGPASLATGATSKQTNAPKRKTFTHSQAPTQYIPQPAPKPITLEENPDAIALRAAISILQLQKKRADADIVELQRIKNRANEDPEGFRDHLLSKKISKKPDGLFDLSREHTQGSADEDEEEDDDDDDEGEDEDEDEINRESARNEEQLRGENPKDVGADVEMNDAPENHEDPGDEDNDEPMLDADQVSSRNPRGKKVEKWPALPARQNVVRMPPINWSQYAVVGESLDKLHEDQRKRPTEGVPQRLNPDGRVKAVEGGRQRNQPPVIAAPYDPFKDKVEKKKTGKR